MLYAKKPEKINYSLLYNVETGHCDELVWFKIILIFRVYFELIFSSNK